MHRDGGWLLGLDGAIETLSLALVREDGGAVLGRSLAGGAQASAQLLPGLRALMAEAGVSPAQLRAIGFGRGPGAFTSLRAVCAATQGLAEGWGLPVLAIDSLLLSVDDAAGGQPAPGPWAAVMDARMGELYTAGYERVGDAWTLREAAALATPEALRARWADAAARPRLAGNGVGLLELPGEPARDRCAALARLLISTWHSGPRLDAAQAQPLYVRDRVALTTAEREAARNGAAA